MRKKLLINSVFNEFKNITPFISAIIFALITLVQSQDIYNPFKVKAEYINWTQVRIKIWSDDDISGFPSTINPFNPWADSLWLMYKTNNYAASVSEANVAMYSTEEIKQAAPDTLEKILTVGDLPIPNDSCWWFNHSVLWHIPSNPDSLLTPFVLANKVFMFGLYPPLNLLVVHGEYIMKTDSALIIIDSCFKLDEFTDSLAVVQCSEYPDFSMIKWQDTLKVSNLIASGISDTTIMTNIGTLPIETDTMYCRWFIRRKTGALSITRDTSFTYGWDRPVYTGTLTADSCPYQGDRMHFEWTAPQAGTDSLRIWWNTSPIPLVHDPGVVLDHAFYPKKGVTIDTISNVLTNNTVYYFGLQIFKDEMWSVITHASSDTMKTAVGIIGIQEENPTTFLNPNCFLVYNNPGNISIRYTIPYYTHVKLEAYDIQGKLVKVIADNFIQKGSYSVRCDNERFSSGVYFINLSANGSSVSKKFTIIK